MRETGRAVAALLLLTVAVPLMAQGVFYREVAKDGRLYVFANGAEYQRWEASGETGKAITRLGFGPNGETVVFDGEDAINLYNFKHDKPGEVFEKPKEAPKPADTFSIKLGTTIFADFTYTDSPQITDADKNTVSKSEFEARRAYINVTGTISEWFSFRVTPDVAARLTTTATGTGLATGSSVTAATSMDGSAVFRLKYAYGQLNLDKVATHGTWVKIGQQQTPWLDFMESIYRYRFQGTLFEEREGFLSSSDVGLSGRFAFPDDYGDIHLGYYNGDTYSKAEANDQKAFQVRASLRPLPKQDVLKGLRLSVFYDHDAPVKDGARNRTILNATFENTYLNAGFEYLRAKDQSSALKAASEPAGWSIFVTPRTTVGLEGIFRYDSVKPTKDVDAKKTRTLVGVAYWFPVQKAPLAAALLADYEQVNYDGPLNKPTEKRFELKALFNY
jgi:hypothetical protein